MLDECLRCVLSFAQARFNLKENEMEKKEIKERISSQLDTTKGYVSKLEDLVKKQNITMNDVQRVLGKIQDLIDCTNLMNAYQDMEQEYYLENAIEMYNREQRLLESLLKGINGLLIAVHQDRMLP